MELPGGESVAVAVAVSAAVVVAVAVAVAVGFIIVLVLLSAYVARLSEFAVSAVTKTKL